MLAVILKKGEELSGRVSPISLFFFNRFLKLISLLNLNLHSVSCSFIKRKMTRIKSFELQKKFIIC